MDIVSTYRTINITPEDIAQRVIFTFYFIFYYSSMEKTFRSVYTVTVEFGALLNYKKVKKKKRLKLIYKNL